MSKKNLTEYKIPDVTQNTRVQRGTALIDISADGIAAISADDPAQLEIIKELGGVLIEKKPAKKVSKD